MSLIPDYPDWIEEEDRKTKAMFDAADRRDKEIIRRIVTGIRWTLTFLLIVALWRYDWALKLGVTLLIVTNEMTATVKMLDR